MQARTRPQAAAEGRDDDGVSAAAEREEGTGVGVERGGLRGWSWAWRTRRVVARGKQEGIEGVEDRALGAG